MELNQDLKTKIAKKVQKLKNARNKYAFDEKNENGTYNDGYHDSLDEILAEIMEM